MRIIVIAAFAAVAAVTLTGCAAGSTDPDATASSPSLAAHSQAPDLAPDEALATAIRAGDATGVNDALAAGANPNLDLGQGVSALSAAVQHDTVASVESLLAADADIEATGDDGRTPLIVAASFAGHEVIGALLAAGADTTAFSTDVYNVSALHAAAQNCNPAAPEVLVSGGMDVNLVNADYGATALHVAAYFDCPEVAEALVILGVSLGAEGLDGKTALAVAHDRGSVEVALLLEALGAPE